MKVFWSWQSDTPKNTGRYFIREILNELANELSGVDGTTESERPDTTQFVEIDHDTLGVAGSPHIADTILRKIREAAVFVADVTPIDRTAGGKLPPNPNVMFELGYALSHLTHERIVLVMNGAHGGKLDQLPFDLRYWRGPIIYSLKKEADEATRKDVSLQLKKDLRERLLPCLLVAANARIAELEQAQSGPKIGLALSPSQVQPQPITLRSLAANYPSIEEIKKETPPLDFPQKNVPAPIHQRSSFASLAMGREIPVSQWSAEEILGYNRRVESYHRSYGEFLASLNEFDVLTSRTFGIDLIASNMGTAPATGVTIELTFPEFIVLHDTEDDEQESSLPAMPERPEAPTLTRTPRVTVGHASLFSPLHLRPLNLVDAIRVFPDERRVEFPIRELMHHEIEKLDPIVISFLAPPGVERFDIGYRIRAREIPRPLTGSLPFYVEQE